MHDAIAAHVPNGSSVALGCALEPAIPRFTVIVTGGTLRPLQHSLVEPLVSPVLGGLHVDIAFIGCNGVDAEQGVTNVNLPEAQVKRRMLESAARAVIVADVSKLGQVHLGTIGDVTEFDALITGTGDQSPTGVDSDATSTTELDDRLASLGAAGLHLITDAESAARF